MADDSEGCLGCLGIVIILAIVWGIIAAVQAYASSINSERLILGAVAAVPTGLIAGALIALAMGKYRKKSKLGPLPFRAHFSSSATLQSTYLPSSVPATASDQKTSAEKPVEAEVITAEVVDPGKADPAPKNQ